MENINLQFEGISKNLKYIFTNNGYYDLVEDKSFRYNEINLTRGVEMLKEISIMEYSSGQITLQEHLSNPRKTITNLINILSPENSINILKEWEINFGDKLLLINESVDNLLIETRINEAWEGAKYIIEGILGDIWDGAKSIGSKIVQGAKWAGDKVVQGAKWVGGKLKQGWEWIKDKAIKAWNCLKNNFVECLMEGLRSAMMSVVGIAVETFLAVTGIGAPIPMILWGLMLVWDVYKMFSGKYESGEYAWSWFDVIIDIVGVATAGAGAAALSAVRGTFKGVKTIGGIFAKGSKMGGVVGKTLSTIGNTIKTIGGKILGALESGAKWIADKFGIKWLSNSVSKAKSVVDDIGKAATGATVKTGTKTATQTVKAGTEKGLSTFGKAKQAYGKAFDSTIGKIGANTKMGKTTLGQGLSKTAQVAAPVAAGMHVLGVNPITGLPYEQPQTGQQMVAQQSTQDLEKDVTSLTSGGADYEAAGLI